MAQHDYSIANGSGAAVRSDLNNALSAIVSQNSGTTEPTTTYAYMRWADTTAGVMKMRNGANNAWITLYQLDGEWSTIAFENGSASAPSIYFKDSGTDTGIYSPGTDQVAISTAGTGRLFVDSSGRTLIGTSSSTGDYLFEVQGRVGTSAAGSEIRLSRGETATQIGGNGSMLGRIWFTSGSDNGQGAQISAHADATWSSNDYPTRLVFATTADAASSPTERMRIDSSGRVGIGTTAIGSKLSIATAAGTQGLDITDNSTSDFIISPGVSSGVCRVGPVTGAMALYTANNERARIDTSGRFLVGTSSGVGKFIVQDSSLPKIQANYNGAAHLEFGVGGSGCGFAMTTGHFMTFNHQPYADRGTDNNLTERVSIQANGETIATQTAAALGCWGATSSNASYTGSQRYGNVVRSANSAYSFFYTYSGNYSDVEFNLRGDGTGLCDGSWTGGGADYAEYFEWSDGNPDEEDRRGISVVLDGDQIRPAEAGEDPIGVISGNPSVVGDAAWNKWNGKYLRDDYGTYIQEDYEVEDEDGNTVIQQRRKLNPAYDPDQEYTSREDRPEWDCVGLMGKLRIRKGQPTGSRWIKMRDISDSVEEWLVR